MTTPPVDVPAADGLTGPAADAAGYVLPKPGRGAADLVVTPEPGLRRHREAEVAQEFGDRMTMFAECQEQFLGELRRCVEDAADSVAEAGRARLQQMLQSALGALGWCDAVQRELRDEADLATQGLQPIDLIGFCGDVGARWAGGDRTVHVRGDVVSPWWGHAGLLAETLEAGLALVAARCQSAATLVVEATATGPSGTGSGGAGEPGAVQLRIAGAGTPTSAVDPALVRTFRQCAERLGARVHADALGPASPGFVLQLPTAAAAD